MSTLVDFLDEQRREALGPVNRWFCSQHFGCDVRDPDTLLAYYIKHGGAQHFRQAHRFDPDLLVSSAGTRPETCRAGQNLLR